MSVATSTINAFGWRRIYDPAEASYPVRALKLPARPSDIAKIYRPSRVLDQGNAPSPPYAWQHWYEISAPDPVADDDRARVVAGFVAPKERTLHAVARRLRAVDAISAYHWTHYTDDVIRALYSIGPVIVGTPWQAQMSTPPHSGIVACEGKILGYHAWVVIGYNPKRAAFRGLNSWGPVWSQVGRFWIGERDLARLLRSGIACVPVRL